MINVKKMLANILQEFKTPSFGFALSNTGTVNPDYSEVAQKNCQLYKLGKIVFCSMRIGYTNDSGTATINGTLFTVPTGFAPAVKSYQSAVLTRRSYVPMAGVVTIDTDGTISINTNCVINAYAFMVWEASGGDLFT